MIALGAIIRMNTVFYFNIANVQLYIKTKKIGISLSQHFVGDIFTGAHNMAALAPKQPRHKNIALA